MDLCELLEQMKNECGCDEIKVYFTDTNHYSIKFIKNDEIIRRIRKGDRHYSKSLSSKDKKDLG